MFKTNLISTTEAAKFLGLKTGYLRKLMMRRVIPYYKPNGKNCYFDVTDLENYLTRTRISSLDEINQQKEEYIVHRQLRPLSRELSGTRIKEWKYE